ncbi:NAC domain-containing protein 2-like [Lycium ferocissimum]|uniref:NAC domain-containing protein 2-like n=1 Tax=Lycium ferocissimum TaxID=112874 RepID=UPI0028166C78|nr:NAC domain-containing protein 2-like [Lycium ferocissimum]
MSGEKEAGFDDQWKLHIPPGFRFAPTDVELIHYLLRRMNGQFIYPGIIQEADVYERNPFHLPGINTEEVFTYFFTRRERKYPKGSKADRSTRDGKGYWKITSRNTGVPIDKKVKLGKKNTLVYYVKTPDGQSDHKTNWIMHEFELDESLFTSTSRRPQGKRFNDFVVCRIYERKTGKEENDEPKDMTNSLIGPKQVMSHNNGKAVLPSPKRKFELINETLVMCHPHDVAMKSNYLYNSHHELPAAAIRDNKKIKDFGQASNTSVASPHIVEEQSSGLIQVKTKGNEPPRFIEDPHNIMTRREEPNNIPFDLAANGVAVGGDPWDVLNRAPSLGKNFSYYMEYFGI